MKLLLDMNLPPRWVPALRGEGFEAVHWSEAGDPRAPDSELMAHAKLRGQVVLTHDLDFGAILAATNGVAPSVVQIRADDLRVEPLLARVTAGLRACETALVAGALVTIDAHHARVRLLPLQVGN